MHAYLATICRDNGAEFVRVGGVADHVHIATTLPRTISQAQLIEQMKKTSSSACPVSRVCVAARIWRIFGEPESARGCVRYIDGQPEHHRTPTFQEEYRELLRKHGVDFDEHYVWD
jgi:putative transposase